MSKLNVEMCPETGICSLVRSGNEKADLMPFEVADLKAAGGDLQKAREIIKQSSPAFEQSLSDEELQGIIKEI